VNRAKVCYYAVVLLYMRRFTNVFVLIFLLVFIGGCSSVLESAGVSEPNTKMKRVPKRELDAYRSGLTAEVVRVNADSLGNTRLVVKIENKSRRSISRLQIQVRRLSDLENAPPIGRGDVLELSSNTWKTVSIPTAIPIADISGNIDLVVSKIWVKN